jgi:LPXTG-motif cell wall-anchored protein
MTTQNTAKLLATGGLSSKKGRKVAGALATGGLSLIGSKAKKRKRLATEKKKEAEAVKEVKEQVAANKAAAKIPTTGATILNQLTPLKSVMVKALQRKGVAAEKMTMENLTEAFYNEFVSKKGDKTSSYEPYESGTLTNNYLFTQKSSDYDSQSDHIAAEVIQTGVTAVLGFIKKARAKKKAKKAAKAAAKTGATVSTSVATAAATLTKEQEAIADDTDKVATSLAKKAKDSESVTTGGSKKIIFIVLGIAAVGLLVFFISRKK